MISTKFYFRSTRNELWSFSKAFLTLFPSLFLFDALLLFLSSSWADQAGHASQKARCISSPSSFFSFWKTILKSHHLNGTVCESRYLLEQLSVYAISMRRRCQLRRVRKHRSGLKRNFYSFLALKYIFRLCVSSLLLNHKRPFIKAVRFHGHLSPEPRLQINFAEASCIRLPLTWPAHDFFLGDISFTNLDMQSHICKDSLFQSKCFPTKRLRPVFWNQFWRH